jgi:hypothetical protein
MESHSTLLVSNETKLRKKKIPGKLWSVGEEVFGSKLVSADGKEMKCQ